MGKVRNVRVWFLRPQDGRREEVAGFWQHGSTPIATFISWLGICIQVHMSRSDQDPVDIGDSRWGLYPVPSREDPNNPFKTLSRYPLQDLKYGTSVPVGDYLILRKDDLSPLYCTPSDFPYMEREADLEVAESDARKPDAREPSFTKRLQDRDRGCCITGRTIEDLGDDPGAFGAVHLFPRTHLESWNNDNLSSMIQDDGPSQGSSSVDSIQNGLLLGLTECHLFSNSHITIDVESNYSVVDFTSSGLYQGRRLSINKCIDGRYKPLDDLLRFHYLQSVLCNVRGPGKAPSVPITIPRAPPVQQQRLYGKHSDPSLRMKNAAAGKLYGNQSPRGAMYHYTGNRSPTHPPPMAPPPDRAIPPTPTMSAPPSRPDTPTSPPLHDQQQQQQQQHSPKGHSQTEHTIPDRRSSHSTQPLDRPQAWTQPDLIRSTHRSAHIWGPERF